MAFFCIRNENPSSAHRPSALNCVGPLAWKNAAKNPGKTEWKVGLCVLFISEVTVRKQILKYFKLTHFFQNIFFCVPKFWRCHLPTESVQQLLAAVGVVPFPEKVSFQLIWISNSITVRPPTFHSTSRIQMVCSRPSSWKFKINVKPVVKMVAARGQHQQSTASPPPADWEMSGTEEKLPDWMKLIKLFRGGVFSYPMLEYMSSPICCREVFIYLWPIFSVLLRNVGQLRLTVWKMLNCYMKQDWFQNPITFKDISFKI